MADENNENGKAKPNGDPEKPQEGAPKVDFTDVDRAEDDLAQGPKLALGPDVSEDSGPGLDFEGLSDKDDPLAQGEDWLGPAEDENGDDDDGPGSLFASDDGENEKPKTQKDRQEITLPDGPFLTPGMKYAILGICFILAVTLIYLFVAKPQRPTPVQHSAQSHEVPASPEEITLETPEPDGLTTTIQPGSLEVGIGPIKPPESQADQGDPLEELLNTQVDPSSTLPGGWNFAPPPEPEISPEASPQTQAAQSTDAQIGDTLVADSGASGPAPDAEMAQGETALSEASQAPSSVPPEVEEVTIIEANDSGTMIVATDGGSVSQEQASPPSDGALVEIDESLEGYFPGDEKLPLVSEIVSTEIVEPMAPAADTALAPGEGLAASTPKPEVLAQTDSPVTDLPAQSLDTTPAPTPPVVEPTPPAPKAQTPAPAPTVEPTPPAPETGTGQTGAATGASLPEETVLSSFWVANLLSTPSKEEADAAWNRAVAQNANDVLYRYEVEIEGTNQHRLRLGFFGDVASAQAVGKELAQRAGLREPWITRVTEAEYGKYNVQKVSDLYAVNISSTPDKAESDAIWGILNQAQGAEALKKLQAQNAQGAVKLYRTETAVNEVIQYRIRLGFFDSNAAAVAAGTELAQAAALNQSRIGQPWAVRPVQSEVEANSK